MVTTKALFPLKIWNARKLYLDYCPKTHRKAVIIILRVIMVR